MKNYFLVSLGCALGLAVLGGCKPHPTTGWQGYLEGEFVYIASPIAGRLEHLGVQKGARVTANTPLFTLERASELAAQREADDRLRSSRAKLEDLKKGSRPSELAALEARLEQGRAAAELSQRDLTRFEDLFKTGAATASDLDKARLTHEHNTRVIDELNAQLTTARLGARTDAIASAEAEANAAAAAKDRADWSVAQKSQAAPRDSLVYDTLFREGEFVGVGIPVVSLLPPENLKVRFFVPEADFAQLKPGDAVQVAITGRPPLEARINYLSPRPEYTPPVLYNRDNRAKLVFMVEAIFGGDIGRDLNPGQPVDVTR